MCMSARSAVKYSFGLLGRKDQEVTTSSEAAAGKAFESRRSLRSSVQGNYI